MNKSPLAIVSIFFIIGILLGKLLSGHISLIQAFSASIFFIIATIIFVRLSKLSHIFLFLSIISVGALLYLNSNIFPPNHISHFLGKDKLKVEIVGTIQSPAEARGVYYGKVNSRYVFEVEAIKEHSAERIEHSEKAEKNEWVKVEGLALVRIQTEKDYQYGDRLVVKGTIAKPGLSSRLHSLRSLRSKNITSETGSVRAQSRTNFNYKQYLENQNIFAIINASEKNVALLAHNYKTNSILRFAYFVREKLKNQFLEKMPLESGAFLRAILLGDRSELPKKLNESFRNSGTMHILPAQNTKKLNHSS